MAIVNNRPTVDVRKVMSGKDGALYDENGKLLVAVESYNSQVAITNQTFQPLGSAQERSAMTSYKLTLTFTEVIVEDSRFFRLLMNALKTGRGMVNPWSASICSTRGMKSSSASFSS